MSGNIDIDALIEQLAEENKQDVIIKMKQIADAACADVTTDTLPPFELDFNNGTPSDQGWIVTGATGSTQVVDYMGNKVLQFDLSGNKSNTWAKKDSVPFNNENWKYEFNLEFSDQTTTTIGDFMLFDIEDGSKGIILHVFKDGFEVNGSARVSGIDMTSGWHNVVVQKKCCYK